jgi:hypothetical protein
MELLIMKLRLISFCALLISSCASFAAIPGTYTCNVHSSTKDRTLKATVQVKRDGTVHGIKRFDVSWTPVNTVTGYKNKTIWYIKGESGVASFRGESHNNKHIFVGSSNIQFTARNKFIESYYGYTLRYNGRVSPNHGRAFCRKQDDL